MKELSFPFRHRLISYLRDLNVRGVRRLSVVLPRIILPKAERVGRHILRTPDGIKLIIDPSVDASVELSLYQTGTYEKGILKYIHKNFKADASFVDVGANIGLMSLYVAKHFPAAMVHAFEAHPKTVKILEQNMQLNSFVGNVSIHPYALGAQSGKVHISNDDDTNRGGASIIRKGAESYEVDCYTLDEILTGKNVGMIKIDVEGYELQVLQGSKQIIETNHPILIIEISRERDGNDQTQEIWNFVEERSYRVYKLKGSKERNSRLVELTDFKDLPEHDNIICVCGK